MSFDQQNNPMCGWRFWWLTLCLYGCAIVAVAEPAILQQAAPQQIVIPPWSNGTNSRDDYFYRLLNLVFTKTESTYGAVEIVPFTENLTPTRFAADLKQNKSIDLVWHGTSRAYEDALLSVPISLTKNLNEYRILLIRKEDQPRFSTVKTLADLHKFVAGSGADWPSRDVILGNGLPVIGVTNTSLLFNMLKAKRFDYISRNIFEVWAEGERYAKEGLAIEQTLLIHGGEPFYFFVSKANPVLANRIEQGLKIAMEDGSFDSLFFSDQGFKRGQIELDKGERRLLPMNMNHLPNSELPLNH